MRRFTVVCTCPKCERRFGSAVITPEKPQQLVCPACGCELGEALWSDGEPLTVFGSKVGDPNDWYLTPEQIEAIDRTAKALEK